METIKLTGITDYAEDHLSVEDLQNLKSFIGCEIKESDEVAEIDGGKMYIMPDGETCHEIFLTYNTNNKMETTDPTNNEQQNNSNEVVALTVIEQALEKENITKQILAKLKADYSGLKINGIDDVEGFNKVESARKHCKAVRIATVSICKTGREKAIQEQKDWIAKEKEVVGEVEEIESELKAESERIKLEKEKILFEAAQRAKLPARKEKLLTIGIGLEDEDLLKLDDFNFDKLFNEFYVKHLEEIAAKAKEAAEAAAKVEAERVKAEKILAEQKSEAERLEAKRIADEKAEEQRFENERLKKEKDEIERQAKEAQEKAEVELAKQKLEADELAAKIKKETEDKLAEEKRLAKIESDRQAEIIKKQQEENERLAKEAQEKAEVEKLEAKEAADKEQKRVEAEKQAALAPDKDKLKKWIDDLSLPFVELKQDASNVKASDIKVKFSNFKLWAISEVEKL